MTSQSGCWSLWSRPRSLRTPWDKFSSRVAAGGWIIFRVVGSQLLPPIAFLCCAALRARADTASPRQETAGARTHRLRPGSFPPRTLSTQTLHTRDHPHVGPFTTPAIRPRDHPHPDCLPPLHAFTFRSGAAQLGTSTAEILQTHAIHDSPQTPLDSGTCKTGSQTLESNAVRFLVPVKYQLHRQPLFWLPRNRFRGAILPLPSPPAGLGTEGFILGRTTLHQAK